MFEHDVIDAGALPEGRDYDSPVVMEEAEFERMQTEASASAEAYTEWQEKLGDFEDAQELQEEIDRLEEELEEAEQELEQQEDLSGEIEDIKLEMAEKLAEGQDLFDAEELAEMEFSKLKSKFEASGESVVPAPRGGDAPDDTPQDDTELSEEEETEVEELDTTIEFLENRDGWDTQLQQAKARRAEIVGEDN